MKKNVAIGIDIGGSKIRAVLWDGKKVISAREIKTPKNLTAFRKALRNLVWSNSRIGVAVPGRVSGAVFVSATNLPYIRNFDFVKFFIGAKVRVDHDARCFARANQNLPAGAVLFITLGTGIGRAVAGIKNGKSVIRRVKKFEYPVRWEQEYKKIRDSRNDAALAQFLAKKLNKLVKRYRIAFVIIGGGVSTMKSLATKLERALFKFGAMGVKVKKSKFGKNAVAVGAASLF